jgi:hypothetical protein
MTFSAKSTTASQRGFLLARLALDTLLPEKALLLPTLSCPSSHSLPPLPLQDMNLRIAIYKSLASVDIDSEDFDGDMFRALESIICSHGCSWKELYGLMEDIGLIPRNRRFDNRIVYSKACRRYRDWMCKQRTI